MKATAQEWRWAPAIGQSPMPGIAESLAGPRMNPWPGLVGVLTSQGQRGIVSGEGDGHERVSQSFHRVLEFRSASTPLNQGDPCPARWVWPCQRRCAPRPWRGSGCPRHAPRGTFADEELPTDRQVPGKRQTGLPRSVPKELRDILKGTTRNLNCLRCLGRCPPRGRL